MVFVPMYPRKPKLPMKLAHKPEIIADIGLLVSDEILILKK